MAQSLCPLLIVLGHLRSRVREAQSQGGPGRRWLPTWGCGSFHAPEGSTIQSPHSVGCSFCLHAQRSSVQPVQPWDSPSRREPAPARSVGLHTSPAQSLAPSPRVAPVPFPGLSLLPRAAPGPRWTRPKDDPSWHRQCPRRLGIHSVPQAGCFLPSLGAVLDLEPGRGIQKALSRSLDTCLIHAGPTPGCRDTLR